MQANEDNRVIASFLARWILGILFLMAGVWKVFTLGVDVHAEQFFVKGFEKHWIPEWLLMLLGLSIPYVELMIGAMVCIGFRIRIALITMGLLLIVTTYGHALQTPLFNIDGHTFTRLILIIFILLIGWTKDRTTLDYWLTKQA